MRRVSNIVMASLEVDRSPGKGVVIIAGGCARKSKRNRSAEDKTPRAKVCIGTRPDGGNPVWYR